MNDGCYDLDGNPLSMEEWMAYRLSVSEDPSEPWRVGLDEFDEFTVSTVWIGTDHHEPPRIWETIVFKHGEVDLQARWDTREQAQRGHEAFTSIFAARKVRQMYRELIDEVVTD